MTIAAAQLGMIGSADAQSSKIHPADVPPITPGTHTSFGSLKQIDAGVLVAFRRDLVSRPLAPAMISA
jgi:hypothetical protein